MLIVPLKPLPAQKVTVSLANQTCQITVRQKFFGLYLDLSVNDARVIGGVICRNLTRIVQSDYLGFIGDLCFIDNQGTDDPDSTGLGTRFSLAYLEASDLAA